MARYRVTMSHPDDVLEDGPAVVEAFYQAESVAEVEEKILFGQDEDGESVCDPEVWIIHSIEVAACRR